ncbi:MAG: DUF2800 domain-containing protein, partial [Patescibacteria group bacterium]|nr:DUF2800 domain-containing protein [Patescibacteria group bacterium]
GNGLVEAKDNDQLVSYLLGAWRAWEWMDEFTIFRGFIHQPKIKWKDSVEYTREEMIAHAERLRRAAKRNMELLTETPAKVQAALTPGVKQCKWCAIRGTCTARAAGLRSDMGAVVNTIAGRVTLTDAELGELLLKEDEITAAFASWRVEALSRAKAGATIPGWKLSKGREGPRRWTNEVEVSELLYEAIQTDAYKRTIISPTEAQKKLKKNAETWNALQPFISRSEAQPTLVPETDPRPPISLDAPEFGIVDSADDLI